VRNAAVAESIDLRAVCEEDELRLPICFAGCNLRRIEAVCVRFHEPVVLEGNVIEAEGTFFASYFLAGLRVASCQFGSVVDVQGGGHNEGKREILLLNTTFKGFVNFFDCWFEGPVVVRGCRFEAGTNLLGNRGKPFAVQFDVPPVIEDNFGELSVDGG
jgi:hypothetical protein